jgi:hypothetical protein
MPDQRTPDNRGNENPQQEKQEITQNKPSHMNQGNKAFYPDQQRKQSSGDSGENEKSGQQQDDRSRKAS